MTPKHIFLQLLLGVMATAQTHTPSGDMICSVASAHPPPAGSKCDYQGSLKKYKAPIATYQHSTLPACTDACINNAACTTFSFNSRSSACLLYGKNLLSKNIQPARSSGVYYWNVGCFKAIFAPESLLPNGDFETGSLAPWQSELPASGDTGTISIVSPGYNGSNYAVNITNSNPAPDQNPDTILFQYIEVCKGVAYEFAMNFQWVSATTSPAGCTTDLSPIFTNNATGMQEPFPISVPYYYGQWQYYNGTFSFNQSGTYSLGFYLGSGCGPTDGVVLVDDVSLTIS